MSPRGRRRGTAELQRRCEREAPVWRRHLWSPDRPDRRAALPGPLLCRSATEEQWVLHDSMAAQLLDPEFASDTVAFMELQVGGPAAAGGRL